MNEEYWTDDELERFLYFRLDGMRSPGVVVGFNINGVKLNYDSVKGFGLSGEFLRFTGLGLAEVGFIVRCVDAQDRKNMDRAGWQRATAPPVQGQVDRIRTISHPIVERMRATTARWRLQTVPFEVPATSEGGGVTVEYSFKNDRKPIQQVGKPADPKSAEKGKVPNFADQAIAGMGNLITAALTAGKT
jgi:hypothetical protein